MIAIFSCNDAVELEKTANGEEALRDEFRSLDAVLERVLVEWLVGSDQVKAPAFDSGGAR